MTRYAVMIAAVCSVMIQPAIAVTPHNALRCNAACGYDSFTNATARGLETAHGPCEATTNITDKGVFRLTFRNRNHTDWRLRLIGAVGDTLTLNVTGAEIPNAFSSQRGLKLDATYFENSHNTDILSAISASGEGNAWNVTHSNGTLTISGGRSDYEQRLTMPLSTDFLPRRIIFDCQHTKGALITDILLLPLSSPRPKAHDITELRQYLRQPLQRREGYWQILDSEFDETLIRTGGDYRLALIADGDDFDIVYIEGARVNPGYWQAGMIKGHLASTPFDGIYDVTWYDAEGLPMSYGLKAQFESDATLSVQFPYQASRIRLQRCTAEY
ncbi:MAG: hypothetical protein K2H47_04290 [Muribaculaceae bacterium]|nr:hypothetical protein [Muribaculaceae bacterium]